MGGGSSTEISNTVIANTTVALAQRSQIDSVIVDKATQDILVAGDNNVVENIHMNVSMTVTDYVAGDANMDADLVSSLTSKFTGSLATQQVALLGALNSSADSVKNLVQNSISAGLSVSTLQRCLAKMGVKESITVIGNNNIIKGVTMDTMQTLYHECVQKTSASVHTAAQTQSWADGSAKSSQTSPLDGLFKALDNLTAGIGFMPLVLAGGGVLVLLIVIFLVFSGGGGSAPIVVKGSGELAPRLIPIVGGLASFVSGGETDADSLADCGIEAPKEPAAVSGDISDGATDKDGFPLKLTKKQLDAVEGEPNSGEGSDESSSDSDEAEPEGTDEVEPEGSPESPTDAANADEPSDAA
jgi:hypothetical protein